MKHSYMNYETFLASRKSQSTSCLTQESKSIIEHFQPAKQTTSHFAPITFLLDYTSGKYIYMEESCFDVLGLKAAYFLETGLKEYLSRWHPVDYFIMNTKVFTTNWLFIKSLPVKQYGDYIFSYNYRVNNVVGEYVTLLQRFSFIPDVTSGEPLGVIGVAFDITHFKTDHSIIHTIEKTVLSATGNVNQLLLKEVYPICDETEIGTLSRKEKEILRLIAKGLSSKQIAGELNISIYTVHNHRKKMLAKTSCKSSSELINLAVKHGML